MDDAALVEQGLKAYLRSRSAKGSPTKMVAFALFGPGGSDRSATAAFVAATIDANASTSDVKDCLRHCVGRVSGDADGRAPALSGVRWWWGGVCFGIARRAMEMLDKDNCSPGASTLLQAALTAYLAGSGSVVGVDMAGGPQ